VFNGIDWLPQGGADAMVLLAYDVVVTRIVVDDVIETSDDVEVDEVWKVGFGGEEVSGFKRALSSTPSDLQTRLWNFESSCLASMHSYQQSPRI